MTIIRNFEITFERSLQRERPERKKGESLETRNNKKMKLKKTTSKRSNKMNL